MLEGNVKKTLKRLDNLFGRTKRNPPQDLFEIKTLAG